MNPGEESVRSYACPFCLQHVGARCRTTSGRACPPHAARWVPLAGAFGEGYAEGERDAMAQAEAKRPLEWADLVKMHQAVTTGITDLGHGEPTTRCSCGVWCAAADGGHPGHFTDVLHEHDLVVARLA